MNQDAQFFLTESTRNRIQSMNISYLSFAQELARSVTMAPALLGVSPEIVHILSVTPMSAIQPLLRSELLLPQLRYVDPEMWRRLAAGKIDANIMLSEALRSIPLPTQGEARC